MARPKNEKEDNFENELNGFFEKLIEGFAKNLNEDEDKCDGNCCNIKKSSDIINDTENKLEDVKNKLTKMRDDILKNKINDIAHELSIVREVFESYKFSEDFIEKLIEILLEKGVII